MFFKHHRRYYSVVQGGADVDLSSPEVCGVFLGTPGVSLVDFHCYSHVFEKLGKRIIPSGHAAVRFVIQKLPNR